MNEKRERMRISINERSLEYILSLAQEIAVPQHRKVGAVIEHLCDERIGAAPPPAVLNREPIFEHPVIDLTGPKKTTRHHVSLSGGVSDRLNRVARREGLLGRYFLSSAIEFLLKYYESREIVPLYPVFKIKS
jgi:hypothetical protein